MEAWKVQFCEEELTLGILAEWSLADFRSIFPVGTIPAGKGADLLKCARDSLFRASDTALVFVRFEGHTAQLGLASLALIWSHTYMHTRLTNVICMLAVLSYISKTLLGCRFHPRTCMVAAMQSMCTLT